jgi:hypothetical protein
MSLKCGGLKRSTQHVMSDARDGVDRRWVKDMFEGSTRWPSRSCGTTGGAHSPFSRVARQLNERSRETLGFETRAERDLMLVLHRPIEPTARSRHSSCRRCADKIAFSDLHPALANNVVSCRGVEVEVGQAVAKQEALARVLPCLPA